MKKGIDVSKHNDKINWTELNGNIDFVMIRAGYGKNNIDEKLDYNVKGCKDNHIPFGFYWFSYALSPGMAEKEADYVCDIADKYKPIYPIAFDWEYDSDNYAKKQGITITNDTRISIARTFLKRVEKRGYFAINYTNKDYYLYKGFNKLSEFAIWYAEWYTEKPTIPCEIWQRTNKAKYKGIAGFVDENHSYLNFDTLKESDHIEMDNNKISSKIDEIYNNKIKVKYTQVIEDVLKGKYGNGKTRRENLKTAGVDYDFVQSVINGL